MPCSLLSRQYPVCRSTSRYRSSPRGLSLDSSGPSAHCWDPDPLHALPKACPPLGVPLSAMAGVVSLSTHRSVATLRITPVPPGGTRFSGGLVGVGLGGGGLGLFGDRLTGGRLLLGEGLGEARVGAFTGGATGA